MSPKSYLVCVSITECVGPRHSLRHSSNLNLWEVQLRDPHKPQLQAVKAFIGVVVFTMPLIHLHPKSESCVPGISRCAVDHCMSERWNVATDKDASTHTTYSIQTYGRRRCDVVTQAFHRLCELDANFRLPGLQCVSSVV